MMAAVTGYHYYHNYYSDSSSSSSNCGGLNSRFMNGHCNFDAVY